MKKKLLACMSLITVAAMLAACGSSAASAPESQAESQVESAAESQSEESTEKEETASVDFPTHYVDFIIGFDAGSGADTNGRLLCTQAEAYLGQSIAVTNKDGAGGALAYTYVAASKPDGYTLSWNSNSQSIASYNGNMACTIDDFKQVCRISVEDMVITAAADSQWESAEDMIADAVANPGAYIMVNGGLGGFNHLSGVAFQNAIGTEFQHMPLPVADQITNIKNGEVQLIVSSLSNVKNYVESGDLKILLTLGEEPLEAFPDVPTAKSLGYDVVMSMYRGISVPAETPDEVVAVLAEAFRQGMESDDYKTYAEANNIKLSYLGPEDFSAYVSENDAAIHDIMVEIGMTEK